MALDNFGATNTCWHLLKPGRLVPTSRAIDHSWTSATAQRWAKLLQVLQASQLRRKCHYTISIQKSKGNCQQNLCQQLCQLIANRSNRSQIASNRSKRVWVVRSSRHSDSPWRASRSAGPLEVFWRAWQPSILISYCQKRAQISLFLLLYISNLQICAGPPPHPLFTYRQTSKRLKRFPSSLNIFELQILCRFSMFLQFLLRMPTQPTQPTQPRAAELTHFLSTLRHRGALHISGLCSTAYHCGVRVQFQGFWSFERAACIAGIWWNLPFLRNYFFKKTSHVFFVAIPLLRATTNAIFIFHFLVENRLSGGRADGVLIGAHDFSCT